VSADVLAFPLDSAVVDHRYRTLRAIVTDGFHGATFHRFFAEPFFFRRFRLLVNVGMAAIIVALEIGRSRFAAQIAIDALIIDIEFASYVSRVLVCGIGHSFPVKMKWKAKEKLSLRN
jgi:hypothetical protein